MALFNRSPAPDSIVVTSAMLGVSSTTSFSVYDVWASSNVGHLIGEYSAVVPSQATVYVVLTPEDAGP